MRTNIRLRSLLSMKCIQNNHSRVSLQRIQGSCSAKLQIKENRSASCLNVMMKSCVMMAAWREAIVLAASTFIISWKTVVGENIEVCTGQELRIGCPPNEILIVTSAEYGRREVGRCIPEADDFMGCTNDVLPLLDTWCSGRRECNFLVPNPDLERANANCLKILKMYLRVDYSCFKVNTRCKSSGINTESKATGYITSYQADTKGCGLYNSAWLISASPGQTITLTMTDFSAKPDNTKLLTCPLVYGHIKETSLGIDHTLCGASTRHRQVYTSKTNAVQVYFVPKTQRKSAHFIIQYQVTGCPELSRPAHAWYKREGNVAVIGCQSTNHEWRLTCDGNKWIGEVGNCSTSVEILPPVKTTDIEMKFSSVVVMTGIAGAAVVLCVVAIVTGTVYIHKYRLRQETKQLKKIYDEVDKNTMSYYGTRSLLSEHNWQMSPDQLVSYPDQCTCVTLPTRTGDNRGNVILSADNQDKMTLSGTQEERQSLYSSIKSN